MLTSTTSKQGLNREVQGALLRVKNGPECLEDNLKELTQDSNSSHRIAREGKKKKKKRKRERELSLRKH